MIINKYIKNDYKSIFAFVTIFSLIFSNMAFSKEYNIAQHIYKLRTQEELNKLNDNKIEFNEIDDLVNTYNATVRNNWNTYEANKDNQDIYNDYYEAYDNLDALAQSADSDVQTAMYRAQADAMRINADKNVVDSTINFLNYYIVEKNICLATKTLFINLYKNNIEQQIKKAELDESKRQFDSAKLNYDEGNLLRVDYLQALKNWRATEADYALLNSNIISAKRNLMLNCGKNITDNVEFGEVRHINIEDIQKINLSEDTKNAIENNFQYEIYNRQYDNSRTVEMQNQNKINIEHAPNYIKADVEEKYYALIDANTSLYTYQTTYEYQEQSRKVAQNEYLQGKISEKQYKTAVNDAYIANLHSVIAQYDLDIAYENYKAVVSGLANAGNN